MAKSAKPRKNSAPARSVKPTPVIKPRRTATSKIASGVARHGTKQGALIEMLRSPKGATIAQMTAKTGWQAHSVRGAISGTLKKKLDNTI